MQCSICGENVCERSDWRLAECPSCRHCTAWAVVDLPVTEYFDQSEYVSWRKKSRPRFLREASARIDEFERRVGRLEGLSVLEIGSSTGEALEVAHARGANVVGVEEAEQASALADARTFTSLDEVEGQFDVVMMFHVLEHIHQPKDFLESLGRRLKRDGHLYIRVPHKRSASGRVFGLYWPGLSPEHIHFFSTKSIASACDDMAPVYIGTSPDARYAIGGARRLLRGRLRPTVNLAAAGYGMPSGRSQRIVEAARLAYTPIGMMEGVFNLGDELVAIFKKR